MSVLGEYYSFRKIFRDLQKYITVGLKLYQARRTDTDAKFKDLFENLDSLLGPLETQQIKIGERAAEFDFILSDGTRVKANGYRSLLSTLSSLLLQLHQILLKVTKERSSMFFLPGDHISNLTAYCRALEGMNKILENAAVLMDASAQGQLFGEGEVSERLRGIVCSEYIARDVFYGRCLGFQYPSSTRPVIKMLAVAMASYERWYKADKDNPLRQLMHSLWKGNKYLQNPTQMGLKLDDLTLMSSVYFVKAFWSIMEQDVVKAAMGAAMTLISHSVEISHSLEIPAKNIVMEGTKGKVTLTPPFSEQLGYRPIPLLFISNKWRDGQNRGYSSKKQPQPAASGLIVHIHGGGFVAQSPRSHEFYLRTWSQELKTPVVSIDYSLSPEAPFPRPVEECTMAYAWILQNLTLLGTTGEHIVLVGDSAGGNLAVTTAMKILEYGLRLPDRIVTVYATFNLTSAASPSRFLSLFDPILPIGVLLNCMQAYSDVAPSNEEVQRRRDLRNRVLRAKGVYIPDPNVKNVASPSVPRKNPEKERTEAPATDSDESIKKVPPSRPPPPSLAHSSSTQPLLAAADADDDEEEEENRSEDVVVSNGGGGGGSNGVVEEGDRLITVDLSDDSPGTSESGESETRLTEDTTPGTGPETEMVDFVGRQKKPLKKRPVLTVSFGHGHCQTLCLSPKRVK
ncbi:Hormone-sensitive lipase [Geodia barretti]|uniref:Hormone-sensitive lipase n=1 Tax=Geodia barretti TaxID=519541 RepID=A0AA35TLH2_GEOBA|nr:Hormone-sensitive lipase [Geodia barretti]